MNHIALYGLLDFILAVELVLGLGLIGLVWILCRKSGAPVPSTAGAGQGRFSTDGSPSSHDQSPPEGTLE